MKRQKSEENISEKMFISFIEHVLEDLFMQFKCFPQHRQQHNLFVLKLLEELSNLIKIIGVDFNLS